MDDLDFSKILQDAEALSSEIEASSDMPRVQRNLRQVLEAGQLLVNRNARDEPGPSAETKASVFLGTRGVDITKLSKRLEPMYSVVGGGDSQPQGAASDADLDAFLRGERTNIIYSSFEATSKSLQNRLQEDIRNDMRNAWAVEKKKILDMLRNGGGRSDGSLTLNDFQWGVDNRYYSDQDARVESSGVLSKAELTYSHEVDVYVTALITHQIKPTLLEKFEIVAANLNDKNIEELWKSVSAMVSSLPVNPVPSVMEKRCNPRVQKTFILRAKQYLEKTFFSKVQSEVWKNLGGGRLGGIPSVTSILKNFVSMKNIICIPGLELGPGECGPIWVMVYIFLRSGHIQDAISYLREEVQNKEFAAVLSEYAKFEGNSGSLGFSNEIETQIRLEYLRLMRSNNTDPYKRLIYCLIGACDINNDHPEIANRLDDYLWLKLCQIRDEPTLDNKQHNADLISYSALQDMILEKYGESHFDAFRQPFTYFQALLLTGQFEAAIEFLSRVNNLKTHAVHIAIALQELGLLIYNDFDSLPLVRLKSDPQGLRRLNYCSLIAQYAKCFQAINTKEALNYLYLLRNIKDRSGSNLFSLCVSDMAIESKNFELLFGVINPDGCRTPGILENMGIKTRPILDNCASKSESNGSLEDAVVLYDLGGQVEAALTILNRLISHNVCRQPSSDDPTRTRIQAIALILAERYQTNPPEFSNRVIPSTFFLLVDLMTFFDEFHNRRTENALAIIERIRILPFEKDDIERCVTNFHNFSDEVRMNVPSLILATMEALHIKYKRVKLERGGIVSKSNDSLSLDILKAKAKSLVTYCGLIPYFMTGDVYSKIMQIEVQIN